MTKCNHIIGMILDYDNTDLATLNDLKKHIERSQYLYDRCIVSHYYTLSQYCDKRRGTDLIRFDYCPKCGEKIDWKAIKRSDNNAE